MGLIDLFHLDDADLADSDAVKSYFDNAWNIALISQESEIISSAATWRITLDSLGIWLMMVAK